MQGGQVGGPDDDGRWTATGYRLQQAQSDARLPGGWRSGIGGRGELEMAMEMEEKDEEKRRRGQ